MTVIIIIDKRQIIYNQISIYSTIDSMSVTIVTGNATFPTSNLSDAPAMDTTHTQHVVNLSYEHVKAALIAIVAGIISITTIVGNIMVPLPYSRCTA